MTEASGTRPADNLVGYWNFRPGTGRGTVAFGDATQRGFENMHDIHLLSEGTLIVQFIQDRHFGLSPDTLVGRRATGADMASDLLDVRVTKDGRVEVIHVWKGERVVVSTEQCFFDPCDTVRVVYAWSQQDGGVLHVRNLTDRSHQVVPVEAGLSLEVGGDARYGFTFGAMADRDGDLDQMFDGVFDFIALCRKTIAHTGSDRENAAPVDNAGNESPRSQPTRPGTGDTRGDVKPAGPSSDATPERAHSVFRGAQEPACLRISFNHDDHPGTIRVVGQANTQLANQKISDDEDTMPGLIPDIVIATPKGERRIGDLSVGDRVVTRDNGIQTIRWTGRRVLDQSELMHARHLCPIRIAAGALGYDLPERDLTVSPNQRVLVTGEKSTLRFEEREVLVAAKHLTGLEGVEDLGVTPVTYVHLLFDRHEVILANGAWTEWFHPLDQSLDGVGNAQRNELFELFPSLNPREAIDDGSNGDSVQSASTRRLFVAE